jgi:Arm DNA-binding domain
MKLTRRTTARPKRAPKEALADFAATAAKTEFTEKMLISMSDALKSGRMKVDKVTFTDDVQPGLRAIVRPTGTVTLHAHYDFDGSRPMIKVGEIPGTTIDEARELTKTIRALAENGIDVQSGLHERLLRELKAQGTKWRP